MNQTISIKEFLPAISSEQEHKIRELADAYKKYINATLEYSDYSFESFLDDAEYGELLNFYGELDEMGVGFGYSVKTEIIGCREVACSSTSERYSYEWFTLVN